VKRLLLACMVFLIAAPALASDDPVKDVRQILAGTVVTKSVKQAYLSGAKDSTTAFQGALAAYKAVRAAEPPLKVTCVDGTIITVPGACPAPPPPPPPPPDWLPSPSLSGLAPIATNFDPTTAVKVVGSLPPAEPPTGAFRFICGAGQILADDPIVFPGQPGKSHLHQFYGNTGANASSTYDSLRTRGGSTCNFTGADTALNRSGYWMPAMFDGKGNVIKPDFVAIYYKRRPSTDPTVSCWEKAPSANKCEGVAAGLPNGLRFIAGWDPTGHTSVRSGSAWFNCTGPTAKPGHYADILSAMSNCPAGNQFGASIMFPECWDGKNLDSPDHRSHVGYALYNAYGYLQCDQGHKYVIPTFQMIAWYSIKPGDDTTSWHLSSDEMVVGQPAGYTFHADWFGAWDQGTLDTWIANCIEKALSCTAGMLGDGEQLVGADVPHYMIGGKVVTSFTIPDDMRLVSISSLAH
jgi:hypothetical protein